MLIITIADSNTRICVDELVTRGAAVQACFLIYINRVLVEGFSPGQIPQTLVMFQAKDLVLMATDPLKPGG